MNKFGIAAVMICMGATLYQCGKPENNESPSAFVADTIKLVDYGDHNCLVINKGDTSWIESSVNGANGKGERVRYIRQDGIIVRADVYKVGPDGNVTSRLVVDTTGLVMLADSCTQLANGRLKYRIINYYPNGLVKSTGWGVSIGLEDYEKTGKWKSFNADGTLSDTIEYASPAI